MGICSLRPEGTSLPRQLAGRSAAAKTRHTQKSADRTRFPTLDERGDHPSTLLHRQRQPSADSPLAGVCRGLRVADLAGVYRKPIPAPALDPTGDAACCPTKNDRDIAISWLISVSVGSLRIPMLVFDHREHRMVPRAEPVQMSRPPQRAVRNAGGEGGS